MSLQIDPEQEARIRKAVSQQDSRSAEKFVSDAIEQALLEAMLVKGLQSGEPIHATPEYWDEKTKRAIERNTRRA
jgi:hypothetical protein